MPRPVLEAMLEAADHFVDLRELQERAGQRIADIVGVEAAHITCGAAGGVTLAAAACITGDELDAIHRLPVTDGRKNEIVAPRATRPNYIYQAAQHVGAKIVEVGSEDRLMESEIAAAINDRTAAVLVVVAFLDRQAAAGSAPSIPAIAAVARQKGVPLIVDAAAELPPIANFQRFLSEGADLVIFSGGKGLLGPQSTGLILGRSDLVRACTLNANPNSAIGRPMKVGKEEIVGLVKAVELFVQRDEAATLRAWEGWMTELAGLLNGVPGLRAEVTDSGLASRPPGVPKCLIRLDSSVLAVTLDDAVRQLRQGEPAVVIGKCADGLVVSPMCLTQDQIPVLARRIRESTKA